MSADVENRKGFRGRDRGYDYQAQIPTHVCSTPRQGPVQIESGTILIGLVILDHGTFRGDHCATLELPSERSAIVVAAGRARYAAFARVVEDARTVWHVGRRGARPSRDVLAGRRAIAAHAGPAAPAGPSAAVACGAARGTGGPIDGVRGEAGHATLELEEDVCGELPEFCRGQSRQLLPGLVAFWVEVVLWQEEARGGPLAGDVGGGALLLPPEQLIVDVCAELLELNCGEAEELVAGPVVGAVGAVLADGLVEEVSQDAVVDLELRLEGLHGVFAGGGAADARACA